MAQKRFYADRSDIGSFATGATTGDTATGGYNDWVYKGLSWCVHGENRVLHPGGHTFYVAGLTLAEAQAAAAVITARRNGIANPTFETDASNWTLTGAGASFVRSTARFHGGAASGLLTAAGAVTYVSPGGDAGGLRCNMLPGHTYTFTCWVYVPAAGVNPGFVNLSFYDFADGGYGNTESSAATAADTWQKLTVVRTVRAGATEAFVRVTVAGNQTGTVNVDDAILAE